MNTGKVAVIIIAAGYSSRMGEFKPFLTFRDKTALERVIYSHKAAGAEDIIVVTGHRGAEVEAAIHHMDVRCVRNESYAQGMFTSVQRGVAALDENVSAFFMHPVDIPLVKKTTLQRMIESYSTANKGILYPACLGSTGHPPLIDCKYKEAILGSDDAGGLKSILMSFDQDALRVPVFDEAVLMDMDTREDYLKLLSYEAMDAPSREVCTEMLRYYQVPEPVIRHCLEVCRVSMEILRSLDHTAPPLNEAALEAAALLHDIARSERNHAQAGAALLTKLGYERVGAMIAHHMELEADESQPLSEREILYLADKLVSEDRISSLEERFASSLQAHGHNPEAARNIRRRWDAAVKVKEKVEKHCKRFCYE